MSAMPDNIVPFSLPKKPKVRQKEQPPDQRKLAVVPLKALTDPQLTDGATRTLGVLCSYCNRAGITWVSQARLAQDLGVTRQAITNQIAQLRKAGYVEIVKKGFRGERANTLRVIFDSTVDTDTAIAVTNPIEDTRPPSMQDETPDPEGQKRIAQLISKALKQPPKKEYQMPKTGQTRTVQRMQEEIAKAKAKRSKSVDNQVDNTSHIGHSPVSNESISKVSNEGLHRQPIGHSTVSQNTENTGIKEVIKEDISKDINVLRHDSRVELRAKGLTDAEIDENLGHLLDAYQAEGLTPDPARLPTEILAMHRGVA